MPGVYGFLQGLSVVVFGTVVGDWVDFNPRLRGTGAVGRVREGGTRKRVKWRLGCCSGLLMAVFVCEADELSNVVLMI